MDVLTYLL